MPMKHVQGGGRQGVRLVAWMGQFWADFAEFLAKSADDTSFVHDRTSLCYCINSTSFTIYFHFAREQVATRVAPFLGFRAAASATRSEAGRPNGPYLSLLSQWRKNEMAGVAELDLTF